MNRLIFYTLLLLSISTFSGCSDYFEPNPDDILLGDDYIADINEFYSGYMGVASKMQKVADRGVLLSELRGDMLEPTENAPQELWEIYNYTNDNNNSYTNPSAYYDVIVNANDYIKKSIDYKLANPNAIPDQVFDAFMSGTIRFKCWTYLMLGKLYGEAIYFDDPMVEYNPDHNYPTLPLDQLINELSGLMTDGFSFQNDTGSYSVNGMVPFTFTDFLYPDGGADLTWNMVNPDPVVLKMELDLWAGKYEEVISSAVDFIYAEGSLAKYKITFDQYNQEWREIFYKSVTSMTKELINVVPFDYVNNQTNNIVRFFSNMEPNLYYLRPTQAGMDRFNNQVRKNGVDRGDQYRGNEVTFYENNGEWVFRKFLRANETPSTVYKNDIFVIMYRASDVHLFLAEALNNTYRFNEAEALINDGIEGYLAKYENNEKYPFNNAVYNVALSRNKGIRFRVDLENISPSADTTDVDNKQESIELYRSQLDSLILEETCLESAGEARSYFAMIRMAKRWNDPSILADRVSAKYSEGKREEVRSRLMIPENWFIEYDLSRK